MSQPEAAQPALPVASIDDLLGLGDEDRPTVAEARPPSRVGWWVKNLLLVLVATLATLGVLRMVGVEVSIVLIIAAYVALRLLYQLVGDVKPPPPSRAAARRGDTEDGAYRWAGTDALRIAVRRWEHRLEWSQSDAGRFSRNVLPVLAELTDERLRQRHGITRDSDPQRARELLGEPLWRMLAEPDRRPPKTRDLTAHVETLEKL
jgi:hypothetical protein